MNRRSWYIGAASIALAAGTLVAVPAGATELGTAAAAAAITCKATAGRPSESAHKVHATVTEKCTGTATMIHIQARLYHLRKFVKVSKRGHNVMSETATVSETCAVGSYRSRIIYAVTRPGHPVLKGSKWSPSVHITRCT
jgi:hypothetical protein